MADEPTAFLMVGLPGAGKTVRATELAVERRALLLTPDAWLISLFGQHDTATRRETARTTLEGRLIALALEALRLKLSVVFDFGLWGRDERSALRWLTRSAGASCQVVYMPVDPRTQLRRVQRRHENAPEASFVITEAELDAWRVQFEVPDSSELAGLDEPSPPTGYANWLSWATERWPSLG